MRLCVAPMPRSQALKSSRCCAGAVRRGGPLLCVVASLALGPLARAGNQRSAFPGGEAPMSAGALVASMRGGDAIWYNPAGLGGQKRSKIDLSATSFTYRLQRVDPDERRRNHINQLALIDDEERER